jgi:SAM-dependent methyltransferase
MTNEDLDWWARQLADAADRSAAIRTNETELREDLDPIIRDAAKALYGLTEREITAERRAGRHGPRRTYDKAYGGMVVEWEWRMSRAQRKHGANQALDYLTLLRADLGNDEGFTAVVSDGTSWGFLASDLPNAQLELGETELTPDQRFQWRPNSPAACRRFLVLLGSNRQQPVTAGGLSAAFGPSSSSARMVVSLLADALTGRTRDDRADTLYREWKRSLEVSYGDLDDEGGRLADTLRASLDSGVNSNLGELLFAVHTYFALIVRLVAIEVLSISFQDEAAQPTAWSSLDDADLLERLSDIDAGLIPSGLEIQNLFERDVFSWYLDVLRGNVDLLNGIRDLLDTLGTFAIPRVAYGANRTTDILRDLYLALVPRALRKALGEFLTPSWLAESCLEHLNEVGAPIEGGRVLDPTCGTGTFLMPILRQRLGRLRAEAGADVSVEAVSGVLNTVVGFDINPIAVTAARVNFVTALGDLATLGPLTLPIWRADSILLPEEPQPQTTTDRPGLIGQEWTALFTSLPEPFPVPPSLASAERMGALRECLEEALGLEDDDEAHAVFDEGLNNAFSPSAPTGLAVAEDDWNNVRQVSAELFSQILELKRHDRNGVWARIIENSFAPLFAGRFDLVVGNPPWLTWTKTPPQWRAAAETVWKRFGLWRVPPEGQKPSRSLASGDVAILVLANAIDRYAESGGFIGLLTPSALVTADPGGRALRQFHLKPAIEDAESFRGVDTPFRVVAADDWSSVKPFSPDASNSPYFLIVRPGQKHEFPVPSRRWERSAPRAKLGPDWPATRPLLRPVPGLSNPVVRAIPTSAWSFQPDGSPPLLEGGSNRWSFGTGLHTRGANGIFFIDLVSTDRPGRRLLVKNRPEEGKNPAVKARRGWVEADLVRPLLRGRDVAPWVANPSGHIITAYDPKHPDKLLTDEQMRRSYPAGFRWLRGHAGPLRARKAPPTRGWNLTGPDWARLEGPLAYMLQPNIVVVRELQRQPAAAIVTPRFDKDLAETVSPLIDHKLTFCAVDTPDEAVYLAAMINSTPIQELLASFANSLAVAPQTLARLPIPEFDVRVHAAVVNAGGLAIKAAGSGEAIDMDLVDEAVSAALGLGAFVDSSEVAASPRIL